MNLCRAIPRILPAFLVLMVGSLASAALVNYSTTGTFSGGDTPGTSTYTDAANGISIGFDGTFANSLNVPPTSFVAFGTFDTISTTGTTSQTVSSGFTLNITQTSPSSGSGSLIGTLQGTLQVSNSQAFVQFTGPVSATIGSVLYALSLDGSNRAFITPPNANFGLSTLNGTVSLVPEPCGLALFCTGIGSLVIRRRK